MLRRARTIPGLLWIPVLAVVCAVLASCRASIPDARFRCVEHRECPIGFACDLAQKLCVRGAAKELPSSAQAGTSAPAGGAPASSETPARMDAGQRGDSETTGEPAADGGESGSAGSSAPGCSPGAMRCTAENLEHCGDDGMSWQVQERCSAGCNSMRSQCNVCRSNAQPTCIDGVLESCRADGSGYDKKDCLWACNRNGTACLECAPNDHVCNGECADTGSPLTCGARCTPCPAARNTSALCLTSSCADRCNGNSVSCNSRAEGCEYLSWDFEAGYGEWSLPSADGLANVPGALASSELQAHGGARSVSAGVDVSGNRRQFKFVYSLCAARSGYTLGFDVSGMPTTFWVYVAPKGSAGSAHTCTLSLDGLGAALEISDAPTAVPNERWTSVSRRWTSSAAASARNLTLECTLDSSIAWSGSVFIDDVTLQ